MSKPSLNSFRLKGKRVWKANMTDFRKVSVWLCHGSSWERIWRPEPLGAGIIAFIPASSTGQAAASWWVQSCWSPPQRRNGHCALWSLGHKFQSYAAVGPTGSAVCPFPGHCAQGMVVISNWPSLWPALTLGFISVALEAGSWGKSLVNGLRSGCPLTPALLCWELLSPQRRGREDRKFWVCWLNFSFQNRAGEGWR